MISCIMPTRNRRPFIAQTLAYFARQDYPNLELIIVDDGDDPVADLIPADPRLRYVALPAPASIGAKRNRACELAWGAIIAHWDDDDWYGPGRLSQQAAPLLAGQADMTGLEAACFFELATWRAWSITPALHARLFVGDVHGGTLVYWRRVWEQAGRYQNISLAEDALFLRAARSHGARLEKLPAAGNFVYLRHGAVAWRFTPGTYIDPAGWRPAEPEAFVPPEDLAFYAALSPAAPACGVAAVRPGDSGQSQDGRGDQAAAARLPMPDAEGQRGKTELWDDGRDAPALAGAAQADGPAGTAAPVGTRADEQIGHTVGAARVNGDVDAAPAGSAAVAGTPVGVEVGHPVGAAADRAGLPLVSCIMPTYNRRAYVARAIHYFQRQDYPARELIILDDGDDQVADLVPADPRIRYERLPRRLVLGAKRNAACEAAQGDIIMHWDDDDWCRPDRLSYQVRVLTAAGAELCGVGRALYYDPRHDEAWLYEYPPALHRWVAGNTLCYRKDYWARHRFPEIAIGEDVHFVWGAQGGQAAVTPDYTYYVALVHAANSCPKAVAGSYWRPHPVAAIHAILGADLGFYRER